MPRSRKIKYSLNLITLILKNQPLVENPQDKTSLDEFPGPKVIKHLSCSTQLSMKSKIIINIKIAKINGIFRFKKSKQIIYPADEC